MTGKRFTGHVACLLELAYAGSVAAMVLLPSCLFVCLLNKPFLSNFIKMFSIFFEFSSGSFLPTIGVFTVCLFLLYV